MPILPTNSSRRPLMLSLPLAARVVAIGLLWLMSSFSPAEARNLTVTTTVDAVDLLPGDGVCRTKAGRCSLRAAIQEANALPGYDYIAVPAGRFRLSIRGPGEWLSAAGDLNVTDNVDIQGAGVAQTIIDGGFCDDPESAACTSESLRPGQDRVFAIQAYLSKVGFTDLTVQNGGGRLIPAGGIFISQNSSLILNRVRVHANRAYQFGGGILNLGGLSIIKSTIDGNMTSLNRGGDETNSGGGILNLAGASLTVGQSTISGNKATHGGGIRNVGGFVDIRASTISHNIANVRGGGIMNVGTMNIAASTIVGNEAYAAYPQNVVGLPRGGGIYNQYFKDADAGLIRLASTIVASNINHYAKGSANFAPDCYSELPSRIDSYRYNLIGIVTDSCGLRDFAGATRLPYDQAGTRTSPLDPMLSSLNDFGGPTMTHRPNLGSPVIDRGPPPTVGCDSTDQRDYVRPTDGDRKGGARCDVGAVEYLSHAR